MTTWVFLLHLLKILIKTLIKNFPDILLHQFEFCKAASGKIREIQWVKMFKIIKEKLTLQQ